MIRSVIIETKNKIKIRMGITMLYINDQYIFKANY
jgi:hypothetical protein